MHRQHLVAPIRPKLHRLVERPLGIKDERGILVRQVPGEDKRHLLPGMDRERSLVAHLYALELDGGVENERIRPGDGAESAVRLPDPWNVVAMLEADDQFGSHPHLAFDAPHDPDNSRMMMPGRHEVDHLYNARVRGHLRLEHHRAIPIVAQVGADRLVGHHLPATVFLLSEQLGETAPGVEAREAKPIDGTISSDKRGSFGVADHRIRLDRLSHRPQPQVEVQKNRARHVVSWGPRRPWSS